MKLDEIQIRIIQHSAQTGSLLMDVNDCFAFIFHLITLCIMRTDSSQPMINYSRNSNQLLFDFGNENRIDLSEIASAEDGAHLGIAMNHSAC
jgi:hypothetical protein